MIEYILGIMATNTVAQGVFAGALAAAPVTMAMYIVKDVPLSLYNWTKRQFSYELTLLSDLDDYQKIVDKAQEYIFWSRSFQVSQESGSKYSTGLGFGTHYGKYNGVFFKLVKSQEQNNISHNFKETSKFTFFTKTNAKLLDFFNIASVAVEKEHPRINVNDGDYWENISRLSPRPFSSVIMNEKYEILDAIKRFERSEADYLRKGLPYHMGILLSGPPGTGKTSLIHALAHEVNRHVYSLNPNSVKKSGLQSLLGGNWSSRFLVMEDVDVSGVSVDREDKDAKINLSELLNSLDGLATPHGLITIATTNHIEKLDPALTRPGRFDYVIEVDALDEDEAKQLGDIFEQDIPHPYSPMTGAELRGYFLKNNS